MSTSKNAVMQGVSEFRNSRNKFNVVELHYTADPGKRSLAWKQRESEGVSAVDWAREYELSWIVQTGRPVYVDSFSSQHHIFGPNSPRGDIALPMSATLVVGYDMTVTATRLAASFNLFELKTPRVWTIDEVYDEKIKIDDFLDLVETKLMLWDSWGTPIHVVDPAAIENISRIEEQACADIMRMRGFEPHPGERSFVKRRKAVTDVLDKMPAGFPHYNVHERCGMHIEGFVGGYAYPELSPSQGGGFGMIPLKNGYSDVHDALQYAISRSDLKVTIPMIDQNRWINSYVVGGQGRVSVPTMTVGANRYVIGSEN